MKINEPITQKEIPIPEGQVLISTTDLKGQITSVNDEFAAISGFSREELIGQNHNIVRHPDMPAQAFDDLWKSLKKNSPWIGVVKNRAKNGDHYWVKAYVAPTIINDELIGYQSVRTKASQQEIQRATDIYKKIKTGKTRRFRPPTIQQKLYAMILSGAGTVSAGYALSLSQNNSVYTIAGLVLGILISYLISRTIVKPFNNAGDKARALINNPLSQEIITGRVGIFGSILLAMELQDAKLNTFIHRASNTSNQLDRTTAETSASFEQTMQSIHRQKNEIEMVAAAINQMTSSIEEVTNNTGEAAESAKNAKNEVQRINFEISETIGIITSLEKDMSESTEVIQRLAQNSQDIGAVLDVIQGIAEQTNLLALNAAIEAARAGEAGRGFAVVADEVRTLATRTADSTLEIEKIINQIQGAAQEAVSAMDIAKKRAEQSFEHVENSAEAIAGVSHSVDNIEGMSTEIARAADQQNDVSQDINRSIQDISENVATTVATVESTVNRARIFSELSDELQTLINQSK